MNTMLTEEMDEEKNEQITDAERADKLFDFFEAVANAYCDIFGARALIELAIDNGFERATFSIIS